MLCEKCGKNEAVCFYQETRNGVTHKMHLCGHCINEIDNDDYFLPFSPFFPFSKGKIKEEKACPLCGMTLSLIQKKGKFGCSGCYDTFAKELDLTPFIGNGYEGKTEGKKKEEEPVNPLSSLKEELKKALEKEEYEKAAVLRDKIRLEEGRL